MQDDRPVVPALDATAVLALDAAAMLALDATIAGTGDPSQHKGKRPRLDEVEGSGGLAVPWNEVAERLSDVVQSAADFSATSASPRPWMWRP